ncbi:hypothetical protein G4Y79_15155 [Phototrophicus methaneseepsis]|uniref:Uncharacterized protein n=1 Tax=Phototrophicus methaneseepsis TaxID=2710758 RepID=A0A7S8E643_9CHLR|nr:hypothetical protein [Phototrophicus methaneseepsis]QPC81040.1 hypothetical protein G4Y79_15155 [Phototrophicus methaneseepsis]
MRKRRPVMWNGVQYPSIYEAAKANGMSRECMLYRVRKKYRCDADVGQSPRRRPVSWNGKRFKSVGEAARANYITVAGMLYRVNQGYTCDADLKK